MFSTPSRVIKRNVDGTINTAGASMAYAEAETLLGDLKVGLGWSSLSISASSAATMNVKTYESCFSERRAHIITAVREPKSGPPIVGAARLATALSSGA